MKSWLVVVLSAIGFLWARDVVAKDRENTRRIRAMEDMLY